ncbi:hypothetical protein A2U01_0084625, partial [Trifolium medium]|nr:hypothetical protein [Trifolium medium]
MRQKKGADWLMEQINEAIDAKRELTAPKSQQHKRWIKRWKRHQKMTKSKCGVKKTTTIKEKRRKNRQLEAILKWI